MATFLLALKLFTETDMCCTIGLALKTCVCRHFNERRSFC